MRLYGLDPGTHQSALVCIDEGVVTGWLSDNAHILELLGDLPCGRLVIEQIEAMGMAVGKEVFETCFFAGRCAQLWHERGAPWTMLPRRTVKLHLCGSMQAKDPNIRKALLDRYGGEQAARKGGALSGIKSHLWSAMALAVTYQEREQEARVYGEAQGVR